MLLAAILLGFFLLALALRFAFRDRFSWGEFGLLLAAVFILLGGGYLYAVNDLTSDTQVLSGKVTGKEKNRVHCRHSYSCNCRPVCSGSGKDRSCYTHCDTCYEHSHDFDWDVNSDIGTFTIGTIDRQGLKEPPRWTQVTLGEPVSRTEGYTNWLKAVPDSVFRRGTTETLPPYPLAIFDYYRIDRVVPDGVAVPDELLRRLNARVSDVLADLGPAKQVNLVFVLTNRETPFAKELQAGWLNGKKNDLVVVIGVKQFPAIAWVDAFGWSANDMAAITARDAIREHGTVDEAVVDLAAAAVEKHWVRKPMEEYDYLRQEIEPSDTAVMVLVALGLLAVAGLSIYFIRNEVL